MFLSWLLQCHNSWEDNVRFINTGLQERFYVHHLASRWTLQCLQAAPPHKSGDPHVLSCLFYCCRDTNGFPFKLMLTELMNMTFSAMFDECRDVDMSGQLTDAPPLSWLSSEALCKGLLLGLVALTWTKDRPCKMSFLSDEAESCWLDSSRWLEGPRRATIESSCFKKCLWSVSHQGRSVIHCSSTETRHSRTLTPFWMSGFAHPHVTRAIDETLRRERGVGDTVFCSPDGRTTTCYSLTHPHKNQDNWQQRCPKPAVTLSDCLP